MLILIGSQDKIFHAKQPGRANIGKGNTLFHLWNNSIAKYIPIYFLCNDSVELALKNSDKDILSHNQNDKIDTSKLDNLDCNICSVVLQRNTFNDEESNEIAGRNGIGSRCECDKSSKCTNSSRNTGRGLKVFLHKFIVNSMEAKRISFTTKGHRVKYVVEATKPLRFFIVNDKEWKKYSEGKSFQWLNKYLHGEYVEEEVNLPYIGNWNLVILNSSDEAIGFNFKVYTSED